MKAGDKIVVEVERLSQTPRTGVIDEVLQESPPRLRVRWDDGRTSIFAPSAGAARIESVRAKRTKATGQRSRTTSGK